jgi:tetratricopeptide (TPR) repeat protein
MEGIIEEARKLKNAALDARDDGRFDEAHKKLSKAEMDLEKALEEQRRARDGEKVGEFEQGIAKQLIHIRGSIGGLWRREGDHVKSAEAYDSGYELERAESGYDIVDSYTLVQRLVARVFIDPAAVDDEQGVVANLAVRPELKKARDLIRDQIKRKGRERDEFAASDLTLVLLLLGEQEWRAALRRFRGLTPAYALSATREVIDDLRKLAANSPRASMRLREDLANGLEELK